MRTLTVCFVPQETVPPASSILNRQRTRPGDSHQWLKKMKGISILDPSESACAHTSPSASASWLESGTKSFPKKIIVMIQCGQQINL
jgi:hypothetical protein